MAVTLKKLMRKFRPADKAAKVTAKLVEYQNDKGSRKLITAAVVSSDGKTIYEPRISFAAGSKPSLRSTCKVSCQCQDFIYTFALPNKAQDALSGKAPKFKDVKGTGQRAPRNPKMTPGICTHLRGLIDKAIRKGLIEG